MNRKSWAVAAVVVIWIAVADANWLAADEQFSANYRWRQAVGEMAPYRGPTSLGVDTSTLHGKIITGYQGWFGTPDDGFGMGWRHYGNRGGFKPGSCSIDYWPHTAELDASALAETPFRKQDGTHAHVFSSTHPSVALKHFEWMKQYGIEAVLLQRFTSATHHVRCFRRDNRVLANVRAAANVHGRGYAMMYDLSGTKRVDQVALLKQDWMRLVDHMGVSRSKSDKAYLCHRGKPVIAVWGAGFRDRPFTPREVLELIAFFQKDPHYGGMTVILGVPTGWRELSRDCLEDPKWHEVIKAADIVSPWTVGRFRTLEQVERHAEKYWRPDMAWCHEEGIGYLPVVFPGFSWANLNKPEAKLDAIPRQGGHFLWKQYATLIDSGAKMIYQAMFDEIDEGTAILKVDNDPPVQGGPFLSYAPQPEDHYLWLVGQAQQMLRRPASLSRELPRRKGYSYPAKPHSQRKPNEDHRR